MNWIRRLDKVRYIPILHLATLWMFGVDSLRYDGRIKRAIKMLLTVVGCILINSVILTVCSGMPEWFVIICMVGCFYGTVIAIITSIRDEILTLNGIWRTSLY